jgi:hypothetical protein
MKTSLMSAEILKENFYQATADRAPEVTVIRESAG